jgi:uncharacterized protein (DUF1015 family)
VAIIKPFRALRPAPKEAAQVASVPYDVVSRAEASMLAAESPHSFLRVTRAEIDLPDEQNVYAETVYQRAKDNLEKLRADGVLISENAPSFYIYRLLTGNQTQTAVVALCSLDEYDCELIKKHEKTRPDKENDRTKHIVAAGAQTGLIFLCYRGTETINKLVSTVTTGAPLYDFTATDGVQHTVWRIAETADLESAFVAIPALYIADGHHRIASASNARQILRQKDADKDASAPSDYVIAALFPAEALKILAYNRVVKDLNGLSEDEFIRRLEENFIVSDAQIHVPEERGEFCIYLTGKWRKLRFAVNFFRAPDPVDALDVSILENYILKPILGIEDVRTDKRIDFVGGIRGTKELEKLVDSGQAKIAFSLFPTTVEDLLTVSDAGEIMPPKSTWFEPKLRDGLLIHKF